MKSALAFALLSSISSYLLLGALAQGGCGSNAGGATCASGLCCSTSGFCGSTEAYCGPGNCQSQCPTSTPTPSTPQTPTPSTPTPTPSGGGGDLSSLIPESRFNEMLKHRTDTACQGGFYTYNAFITAAQSYPAFGTTGDTDTRKREIAAFFGQTSHETKGGSPAAPDGPYAWGYCFVQEKNPRSDYCKASTQYPCAPGKKYYGRGPIMLTWNYNYGQAAKAVGADILKNPDLVVSDPVISFKTALWFWMTPQSPKPSSHDVIVRKWNPSPQDKAANRLPGYGVITNIINGGEECGKGPDPKVQDRIGFYRRYCTILGTTPGDNLDCANQKPFVTT